MPKRWSELTTCSMILTVAALAIACGGGGGGGGGTGVTPTLQITEDNADNVAGAVCGGTISLMIATQESPVEKPGASPAAGFGMIPLLQDIIVHAITEEVIYYDLGGTATITLTDRDDSRDLSRDDRITAVYNEARQANNYVDGAITMQIDQLVRNEDTDYVNVRASVSVVNLVVGYVNQTRELDGEYTLSMQITPATGTAVATIRGTSLEVTEGALDWTILNFEVYYRTDSQEDTYEYRSSGGIEGTDIGGTVSYRTVTVFEGATLQYPTTGSIQILGTENSKLTVSAVDNVWVAISLDADGNNTPDYQNQPTWAELLAGD